MDTGKIEELDQRLGRLVRIEKRYCSNHWHRHLNTKPYYRDTGWADKRIRAEIKATSDAIIELLDVRP